MRTIVPFVLTPLVLSIFLCAQAPRPSPAEQIERLEKRVADGREAPQDRITLLNLYKNTRDVEGRRGQLLWLTEHRPEIPEFRRSSYGNPTFDLRPNNSLPDAVGFNLAAELWRAHAAKPDASLKVIANAAYFFRFADGDYALSILKKAAADHPGDLDIAKVRGLLDVLSMGGLMDIRVDSLASDQHARMLPAAKSAREDVDSSHDPTLLGTAAEVLSQEAFMLNIEFQDFPALGGDDALDVAERWVARAIEIEPDNKNLKATLAGIYTNQGRQAVDPRFKVQLLRKADALIDSWPGLPQLAMAEFDAGDDEGAIRDAHRMLDRKNAPPNFQHFGHTVLGRVAAARGDLETAKAKLTASVPASGSFPPSVTLAQELLDAGERDAVIQFLTRFKELWQFDQGMMDHWIKLAKSPEHADLSAPYRAGRDSVGRKPKLPEELAGRIVLIQFRNAACKTCDAQFEIIRNAAAAGTSDVATLRIDETDKNPLAQFLEVEAYPSVVLIWRDGGVRDVIAGRVPDQELRNRIDGYLRLTTPERLPAPRIVVSEVAATLEWEPVPGAESYLVQWDQRDEKGWVSDRDEHLVRVIPAHGTSVKLDASLGETAAGVIRWRVFGVSRSGPGATSEWREMKLEKP